MRCPKCSRPMRDIEYEEAIIHTCDGCGGEFIGSEALTHIISTREQQFDPAMTSAWASAQPTFGLPESQGNRLMCCPCCDTAMEVGNYSGDTGVHIDRCPNCGGVWLDCDELEKIQYLIETWQDHAPTQMRECHNELVRAQQRITSQSRDVFQGSRFAFVNALVNHILDAA